MSELRTERALPELVEALDEDLKGLAAAVDEVVARAARLEAVTGWRQGLASRLRGVRMSLEQASGAFREEASDARTALLGEGQPPIVQRVTPMLAAPKVMP